MILAEDFIQVEQKENFPNKKRAYRIRDKLKHKTNIAK